MDRRIRRPIIGASEIGNRFGHDADGAGSVEALWSQAHVVGSELDGVRSTMELSRLFDFELRLTPPALRPGDDLTRAGDGEARQIVARGGENELITGVRNPDRICGSGGDIYAQVEHQIRAGAKIEAGGETSRR